MKKLIYILGMLACATTFAQAQTLTLDDCKRMAKENNYELKNKALEQQIATQTSREAFTNYFPVIDASGSYFNANKGLIQMPAEGPDGEPGTMSMLKKGKSVNLMAMQPVFSGGQIVNGNKLAKIGKQVSRLQYEVSEDEVEKNTENYFWQVIQLQEKLKTVERMEQQIKEIRKEVELSIQAGLTTRNDLLRVELQENELASNRLKIENGISISKLVLRQYIGERNREFELQYEAFTTPLSPIEYYVDAEVAVQGRPEKYLLDSNVEANKLQKRIEVGKYLPSVGVGATYSYDDMMGKNNTSAMMFATVSVPISKWWGGSHSIKKQNLKWKQAVNERQNNIERMEVQVEQTWNELQEAYKQILLAQRSIASAAENMRMNQDFFKAGTVTLTDVLDAQTLLQQSNDQFIEACTEYQLKLTEYKICTNR
ncbi:MULTISPECIES: TolC family protein [Bacteroides]|uniref:TolC family protein n=1 Tax=Bacteroides TaxID=816 RepID=UPI00319D89B5